MLTINHGLIDQDSEEKFAEIEVSFELKENWENEKSDALKDLLTKKLQEQFENHLNLMYDNANCELIWNFESKVMMKSVKYLDRLERVDTIEEFISIVQEVFADDYDGLNQSIIEQTMSPGRKERVHDCGSTLARILEDHTSNPSYCLDILGEHAGEE